MELIARKSLVAQQVAGEVLLFDSNTGSLSLLDETATWIWNELAKARDFRELVHNFSREFKTEPGLALRTVRHTVEEFIAQGLVEEASPIVQWKRLKRRDLLKAAAILPVVTTLAPTSPAVASSATCNCNAGLCNISPCTGGNVACLIGPADPFNSCTGGCAPPPCCVCIPPAANCVGLGGVVCAVCP